MKLANTLIRSARHPIDTANRVYMRYIYKSLVKRNTGIYLGNYVVFVGKALIDVRDGAKITIGDHVLLNSRNTGYHINMHSPVKLLADRPGAEIVIGNRTRIHGVCLHAYQKITIGCNCLIAANTQIMDGSGHDLSFNNVENRIYTHGDVRPIHIEDNVWIGANCIILPGVTIGDGSVIGAGSVVTRDIPPFVVAAGNPARVVKDMQKYRDNPVLTQ